MNFVARDMKKEFISQDITGNLYEKLTHFRQDTGQGLKITKKLFKKVNQFRDPRDSFDA